MCDKPRGQIPDSNKYEQTSDAAKEETGKRPLLITVPFPRSGAGFGLPDDTGMQKPDNPDKCGQDLHLR